MSSFQRALSIRREIKDLIGTSETLDELGKVYRRRGMWKEAIEIHQEACDIWRELANINADT